MLGPDPSVKLLNCATTATLFTLGSHAKPLPSKLDPKTPTMSSRLPNVNIGDAAANSSKH